MNRRKQHHDNTDDHYNNGKRITSQITTTDMDISVMCNTHFEHLSNEIIYEIFDFLDMYDVYEAFSNLNIRFDTLLNYSTLPLKINMKYLSKSKMQHYYTQFIMPNIHRIDYLHLWNPFIVDLGFPSLENIEKFNDLKTLVLDNIISDHLLDRLTILPNLSSLIINQVGSKWNRSINYHSIIRLRALKYLKISCEAPNLFQMPSIPINELSLIEHLVINCDFNLNDLAHLLSYVPYLRRLSIDYLHNTYTQSIKMFPKVLNNLTHVSLNLKTISFDQFEPFLINVFQHVQVLRISTTKDKAYLNAERWERLILSRMNCLRVFDLQCLYHITNELNRLTYDNRVKRFTSSFWTERKWYFAHQHYTKFNSRWEMFYSIQPYRRRSYMLYGSNEQYNNPSRTENNFHLIRHAHIQNTSATNNCSIYFPNATELTISGNNYTSDNSIITILDGILSLKQLNQIILDGSFFNIKTLIEMLYFTPNCYKLRLNRIGLEEKELKSLRDNTMFQLVSNRNQILELTIKMTCTLEEIKLLVKLCPRLQHLTINVSEEEFHLIIKFLLSKTNKNTRHLTSLYIASTGDIWIEKLYNQLQPFKPSDGFSIEEISYTSCYLWW